MLEICSLRSDKKEVRSWRGGREEFRLAGLSRWIVASEWILWSCTGYIYPDGHVSLLIWARANRIIRWANWEQVSWLLDNKFWGKDKFRKCLIEYLYDEDFDLESWWGWREREFRLGEIGCLTEESGWIKWECTGYLYPVMAQSSDRPIGERLKIAMFVVGLFDLRGEVRDDGFSELLSFCG